MTTVFVALGSNLGDRSGCLRRALDALHHSRGLRVQKCSTLRRTDPVGGPPQPDYVNAVAQLECSRSPEEMLSRLHQIEARSGRVRTVVNGPRCLDLDLLLYGAVRWRSPRLQVPHPRMGERRFVLEPLAQIAPRLCLDGRSLPSLLAELPDSPSCPSQSCSTCAATPS